MIWYFSFRIFFQKILIDWFYSSINTCQSVLLFILITLIDDLCIIAFQLLIFQEELSKSFFKDFQEILALIKSIRFRSIIVKSRTRQIRSKSIDSNNINSFFSFDWVIDKSLIRKIIKQYLLNTKIYRLNFQKFRKFEKITSQLFISSFIENKFLKSFLTLLKHKHDFSNSNIISIVWSKIIDIFQNSDTMSFKQSSSNIFANFDLISKQMQTLSNTISITVNIKINRLSNELRQLLQSAVFSQQLFVIIEQRIDVEERSTKDWTAKKVEYFDSTADDFEFVINLKKYVFYKNVYAFVDKLKNVSSVREKDKFRLVILQCFRDIAFIWHLTEFSNIEKEIYRDMFLQNWYNVLIKRFKERVSAALNYLQSIKYTFENARKHKDFRVFAQNLFKHVKIADLNSVYNQLVLIWNNLNWQFRQHVSQFTEQTTIQAFLKQFDNNCDIWFEMTFANTFDDKKFFANKSHHDATKKNFNRYFNLSDRYFSLSFKQKNIYMNNSQNQNLSNRSSFEITIKMKNSKKSN